MNTLHLYAQRAWHDDADIVGTRDALECLLAAIDTALETGQGETQQFAKDGEGYTVNVRCVTEDQASRLAAPYVDDCAKEDENNTKALWPWGDELMSNAKLTGSGTESG